MRCARVWLIALLCGSAIAPPGAAAGDLGPSDRAELEAFLDGAVQALLEAHRVPGAAISVVKDGEILLAKGYGYADVERRIPVDPERSLFRIASVSKLFAWTALMQLVERGEVDLDRDVNAYLDFEIPATFPEPITPRHLLTHTAGFEDRYRGLFGEGIEDLAPLGRVLARNLPGRVMPPGREAAYSNYGAALAGYIVERVSGLPFERYVEERIFAPLGMGHSTFRQPVPAPLAPDLAIGYVQRDVAFAAQEFEYDPAVADGAMSTSAVDMARFMLAHLGNGAYAGRRILGEETAVSMRRRLFTHDPRIAGMAHGFYEIDLNGQRGVGHGGDLLYHHTDLLLLPDRRLGLFASFNSDSGSAARDQIVPLFLDRYFPAAEPAPPEPPADFASRAGRFTGRYRLNRRAYRTLEKAFVLAFGDARIRLVEPGALLIDFAGMQARMVEVEPLLFRVVSGDLSLGTELVAFGADASGDITRVYPMPVMALHRLAWYETTTFHFSLLAVCLVVFALASLGALRRLRRAPPGRPASRWRRRLTLCVSLLDVVFAAAFATLLLRAIDAVVIPDDVAYLLVLPVVSAALTLGFALLLAWEWRTRSVSGRERVVALAFGLAAFAYLWCLDYWNLLGWHY